MISPEINNSERHWQSALPRAKSHSYILQFHKETLEILGNSSKGQLTAVSFKTIKFIPSSHQHSPAAYICTYKLLMVAGHHHN